MSNSHINKLKSGVGGGWVGLHHISPMFSAQQYVDHWHVWISEILPSSTIYSCSSFPFWLNGVFTDSQTVLLHLQASGNNSLVKSQASGDPAMVKSILPTLTHAIQECKRGKEKNKKSKRSQQKGTKADTCHVTVGTFPYREHNVFVDTPSTLERKMWRPFWRLPFSPEGWNGLSKLTGSRQGGQGKAGLCSANSWTPSPLCGLGPAAVHQTPCLPAGDDAFCRFKEPL